MHPQSMAALPAHTMTSWSVTQSLLGSSTVPRTVRFHMCTTTSTTSEAR